MIESIQIKNFKCFQNNFFEFRPLTLLAGFNGSGKSSLLQALLLMRQALTTEASHVKLNGPHSLRLGRVADVFHHEPTDRNIEFLAHTSAGKRRCYFEVAGDLEEELILEIGDREPATPQEGDQDLLAPLFNYLHAERLGPRDFTSLDSAPARNLSVGSRGEFTSHVLVENERTRVSSKRLHPASDGNELLQKQVELWMRSTVPGLEVRSNRLLETNLATLRFRQQGLAQDWLRPPNTGFGISYSVPVIVAGLLAPKNTLFIVENPEAHLHPAGQSSLGGFLATIAADGVQVIVETHSDHVLNGIRLATVREGGLQHDQVIIHYFSEGQNAFEPTAIDIDARGGLTHWPQGFFDQSERDLAEILRARKTV